MVPLRSPKGATILLFARFLQIKPTSTSLVFYSQPIPSSLTLSFAVDQTLQLASRMCPITLRVEAAEGRKSFKTLQHAHIGKSGEVGVLHQALWACQK